MDIEVTLDRRALKGTLAALMAVPKEGPRVISRSLNRTIVGTRVQVIRSIRDLYTIKAGDVRDKLKIEKASPGHLVAVLKGVQGTNDGKARTPGLQHFRHSPTNAVNGRSRRKGVRVKVRKDRSGGVIKGTFLLPGKIGIFRHSNVIKLTTERPYIIKTEPRKTYIKHYAIERLFGPDVPGMMKTTVDVGKLDVVTLDRLVKELDGALTFLLSKK